MIKIKIDPIEVWNSEESRFEMLPGGIFAFENSLRAISKWESYYAKPYLSRYDDKTPEEVLYYYKCMCMTNGFRDEYLTPEVLQVLYDYTSKPHSATKINRAGSSTSARQIVTSEYLYASMAVAGIPFECDKWEIGRLIKTLECVDVMMNPKKSKRSSASIAKDYASINKARLAKYKTKG